MKRLNQTVAILATSRRTYSISQLPAVELFLKTATVALRTKLLLFLYTTVDADYECVPIYMLLSRQGLRHPLQGLTAQVQGSFKEYAIYFGPGD